jgi:hypothetical protein
VKKVDISDTFLLITFFGAFFQQLFQRIQNWREILRFLDTFLDFFKKKPSKGLHNQVLKIVVP